MKKAVILCRIKIYEKMTNIAEYLSVEISVCAWGALALAFVCALLLLVMFRSQVAHVRRRVVKDDETPMPVDGYPAVSVVVFSQGDSENLRVLLPQILEQDYPAPIEVIVVNDEKSADTADVVSELELRYRNLYMTFAPERSRNLSRKKLSITLGLKAARYDAVALTCGNCRIESPLWLRLMMRHFIDGKSMVLGYSLPAKADADDFSSPAIPAHMSRAMTFDLEWSAVRAYGAAIAGRPRIGDGYNLAYSRKLFFDNKGFSRSLNLNFGDDDVFVCEVASADNCAVELSPDSRVLTVDFDPAYAYGVNKVRRMFTARFIPKGVFRIMGLYSCLCWGLLVSAVAATVLALPSLIGALGTLVAIVVSAVPCMVAWRKTGRALGIPRQALLTQPFLMLWHPFYNIRYRRRLRKVIPDQYTWGQKL